ncbi:MAG: topoisomerase catalytic core domain protein [Gemmatimonadetes bacterium]|nr:topoisomerase catalytic core domain protein [Gemmatimonadota bacterium]
MDGRWITRLGTARSGFHYERDDGRAVRDRRTLDRIAALVVPPAWAEVHIALDPRRAVQAWGFDARGRKQYRYHAKAAEASELRKYYRVRQLAKSLPEIRKQLRDDSRGMRLGRDAVAAIALRLIGERFFRIGSARYAEENGTFGLTTLQKRHVQIRKGCAVFDYVGKLSIAHRQVVTDRELSRLVARLMRTPGKRLFRYKQGAHWSDLDAREVNDYLRDRTGESWTAKDFRTWGGTLRAATVLAELGPAASPAEAKRNVALAMRLVSSELGNTPLICRKSYVHPMVIARYLDDGETIALPRSRRGAQNLGLAHSPEERALIAFLDRHFPERRKKRRDSLAA